MITVDRIPLDRLIAPQNGFEAVVDVWWVVDDEGAFMVNGRPQCNHQESIAKTVQARIYPESKYPGVRLLHVLVAYIPRRGD